MIFVAVGTQAPFDRLVQAVDEWAGDHPEVEVRMQSHGGTYPIQYCAHEATLTPARFHEAVEAAELIVSHAGIGTIIAAREAKTPLILLPRDAGKGEHRNNHQLDTVRHLPERPGIRVVMNEAEIGVAIEEMLGMSQVACSCRPSQDLIQAVQQFILGNASD